MLLFVWSCVLVERTTKFTGKWLNANVELLSITAIPLAKTFLKVWNCNAKSISIFKRLSNCYFAFFNAISPLIFLICCFFSVPAEQSRSNKC